MYKSREDQGQLLQQVLSATDADADEERIPGEGPKTVSIVNYIFLAMNSYRSFEKLV